MFSKTQDDRGHGAGPGQVSVLASDLIITGVVASEGTIELHGAIDGEMSAAFVVIGHDGRMKGRVQAGQVELRGELDGAVTCGALTLRRCAKQPADHRIGRRSGRPLQPSGPGAAPRRARAGRPCCPDAGRASRRSGQRALSPLQRSGAGSVP